MNITFLGATGTVTGSKYLVEGSAKVLIDCGLFQGYKQLRLRNRAPLPAKPSELDAVVLTHSVATHRFGLLVIAPNEGCHRKPGVHRNVSRERLHYYSVCQEMAMNYWRPATR